MHFFLDNDRTSRNFPLIKAIRLFNKINLSLLKFRSHAQSETPLKEIVQPIILLLLQYYKTNKNLYLPHFKIMLYKKLLPLIYFQNEFILFTKLIMILMIILQFANDFLLSIAKYVIRCKIMKCKEHYCKEPHVVTTT